MNIIDHIYIEMIILDTISIKPIGIIMKFVNYPNILGKYIIYWTIYLMFQYQSKFIITNYSKKLTIFSLFSSINKIIFSK